MIKKMIKNMLKNFKITRYDVYAFIILVSGCAVTAAWCLIWQ